MYIELKIYISIVYRKNEKTIYPIYYKNSIYFTILDKNLNTGRNCKTIHALG